MLRSIIWAPRSADGHPFRYGCPRAVMGAPVPLWVARSLRTLQGAGACNITNPPSAHSHHPPQESGVPRSLRTLQGAGASHITNPPLAHLHHPPQESGGAPFLAHFARGGRIQHHKPAVGTLYHPPQEPGCPVPCVLSGAAYATSQTRRWHTYTIRPRNRGCPVPCVLCKGRAHATSQTRGQA